MWKLAKQAIHNSLNTRINGSVNPKLLQRVRVFQWRWPRLEQKTAELMNDKKTSRSEHIFPCKNQYIIKMHFENPRDF
jgi:hypothetical protein